MRLAGKMAQAGAVVRPLFARLFVILAGAVCICGDAWTIHADGYSAEPVILRVATMNLENYLLCNRMAHGRYRFDYPKPEQEKTALRAVIREVDPDVLALQEVGDDPFLHELLRDLRREGIDYPHKAFLRAADDQRHLAVVSKYPIQSVMGRPDLDFAFAEGRQPVKRGLLGVDFTIAQTRWTLFVAHLKSQYSSFDNDPGSAEYREKEARAIRQAIMDWAAGWDLEDAAALPPALLVGDLNDSPNSPPVRRLLSIGERPLFQLVPAADSRGEHWTYFYRKADQYSRFDYILATGEMKQFILPASDTYPAVICDLPLMRLASDHRMVYLDLSFAAP